MNKTEIVKDYIEHFLYVVVVCIIGIILSPWLAWKICDYNFFR